MKIKILGNEINISKLNLLIILLIFTVLVLSISIYVDSKNNETLVRDNQTNNNKTNDNEINNNEISGNKISIKKNYINAEKDQDEEEVNVYVVGCVNQPGIVTIKKGALLDVAIKKAGGVTQDADLNLINMVYEINNNIMIKVLSKSEIDEKKNAGNVSGITITDGLGDGVDSNDNEGSKNTNNGKININIANQDELMKLPGVGEVLAKNILNYRNQNGKFNKIEDLNNVTGIGDKKFKDIKEMITI